TNELLIGTPQCGRRVPRLPRARGPSFSRRRRLEGRPREPPEHHLAGREEPQLARGRPVRPRGRQRCGGRACNGAAQRPPPRPRSSKNVVAAVRRSWSRLGSAVPIAPERVVTRSKSPPSGGADKRRDVIQRNGVRASARTRTNDTAVSSGSKAR